jgi:hypothetical protein
MHLVRYSYPHRRDPVVVSSAVDLPVTTTTVLPAPSPSWRIPWPRDRQVLAAALLPLILVVQVGLSFRLIWVNTAFQDEALYLWAGRLEIAHWLHGTPIPAFPTYFSGAPIVYPPIAALASDIGGLAAARILSLIFMLGATTLLWCTTRMLFGTRAAFFATAVWALLGPTLQLGAFATFDAMSLFLMAAAACLVVRAGMSRKATGWTLAAAAALVLSNITAYSSLIFDPVVLALATLAALQQFDSAVARSRVTSLLAYAATGFAVLLKLGGTWYVQGIMHTVIDRATGTSSAAAVLSQSWAWIGLVILLAAAGTMAGLVVERGRTCKLILATLLLAVLLVPIEQARIHTLTSLYKHADLGAWFAAIVCGYAVNQFMSTLRPRMLRASACVICTMALYFPLAAGIAQSAELNSWPNAAEFVTWMRVIVERHSGPVLVETPSISEYYLPAGEQWRRWSSTFNIMLPSGHVVEHSGRIGYPGDPRSYEKFIAKGYFSVIALNHGLASALDRILIGYIEKNSHYHLAAVVPYGKSGYSVWVRTKAAA